MSTNSDRVWLRIREEAEAMGSRESLLLPVCDRVVLRHHSFEESLVNRFAEKIASSDLMADDLRKTALRAHEVDPGIGRAARADIIAVFDRDPACHTFLQPLLYFKGFQALQCYRIAHWLWRQERKDLACLIQTRVSELFGVDIHPNARLGQGILIDHAHAIVIGETSVVGDNVSMLHSVTLGGTGKVSGDRHPKVGKGVLLGAGAIVLGSINVGNCSRIAAGSVVLQDVPPYKTVAGIPARVVGEAGCDQPSETMDQHFHPSIARETT
ncbi:MAG: serine O-acetyltransferase [Rhodobacteraceae bacterium]|nr:serine O-acetyltransferase [Paracoccaceae bacterium]